MRPYLETESLWIKSQAKIKRDALRGAQAPGGTALPVSEGPFLPSYCGS